jgi:hypothetical protein
MVDVQHESLGDVRGRAMACRAGQNRDLDPDGDPALVACGIPGVECLRGDGCGEFVGRDPLCGAFPLNPGRELRECAIGGEITGEGFAQ